MADALEFFARVAALGRDGRPFAIATVVARRAPVSAHLGDRAIVYADGRMDGFVGGACSREIVRRQALDALRTRTPRLVCIRPDAAVVEASADRIVVPMTCASEGAVDVYVEPIVRPRSLVVVGATPVADAVSRLAGAMRWDVQRVVEDAERRDVEAEATAAGARLSTMDGLGQVVRDGLAHDGDCAAVVASQGHYDEPALEIVLSAGVPYVGLVASRARGATVRAWLTGQGVPNVERLRNPAGLDLGGRTAEEVALSILGEIVTLGAEGHAGTEAPSGDAGGRALPMAAAAAVATAAPAAGVAIDPVCHMEVAVAGAAHTAEVEGVTYYFCCGGCRTRFLKEPQRYLAVTP
jgi:xanthine dehydrogenase accessory factor